MRCPVCGRDNQDDARFCDACAAPLGAAPSLVVPPAAHSHSAPSSGTGRALALEEVFVGRERELAEARAGLQSALLGQGQVVLLAGEPGIGKTRLATELATEAHDRGAQVLTGQTYEWEGTPAYWPWVQVLRQAIREGDPRVLRDDLGQGAATIAQIVPEIAELLPGLPAVPRLEPEQARFQLFDALTTFLKRTAERRPVVLILDDLHWADRPSLLLLEFVARETGRTKLLILGTYRDVEVGRQHPLAQTLAELNRARLSRRILLRGLGRDDVARFIGLSAGSDPPDDLVDAVYQETEGNPFFVTEVVRLLAAEGRLARPKDGRTWSVSIPESVREVVGLRLGRLSEACNQALAVASVVGREFRLASLERVTRRPADEILDLLEEAVQARLVEEQDALGHYRFSHALVQETLYGEFSSARRARLHGQIGEAIEQAQAANLTPYLGELAQHYFEAAAAGKAEQAIDYARRAAEQALEQVAWETAIGHFQRALQVIDLAPQADRPVQCELLLGLGSASRRAGDLETSAANYARAAEVAREHGSPEQFARAALGYAGYDVMGTLSSTPVTAQLLQEALECLGPGDSALRAKVLSRLAWIGPDLEEPDLERFQAFAHEAVAIAERIDDTDALLAALDARFVAECDPDHAAERLAIADELVRRAETAGSIRWLMGGLNNRVAQRLLLGDIVGFDRDLERVTQIADELRLPLIQAYGLGWRAMRAVMDGRFAEAEQLAGEMLPVVRVAWSGESGDWADADSLFVLYRDQGRLAELNALIKSLAVAGVLFLKKQYWQALHALLMLELGREDQATAVLERWADTGVRDDGWLSSIGLWSHVAAQLGDVERSGTFYALLQPYAACNIIEPGIALSFYGSASYYLGMLATILTRWDDAAKHFNDALARHENMGARPFAAHTRYAYASMLVQRDAPGDREHALSLLDLALAAAEDIGMTRLAGLALALKVRLQGILKA